MALAYSQQLAILLTMLLEFVVMLVIDGHCLLVIVHNNVQFNFMFENIWKKMNQ